MKNNRRYAVISIVILFLLISIVVRLQVLMLAEGEKYASQSTNRLQKTIAVKGDRGMILDRNGIPLAYDQSSYNVMFSRDYSKNKASDRARYTEIIMKAIDIIEANGGKLIDTFAIRRNENFEYYFNWGDISEQAKATREANWRKNMSVGDKLTPEEIYIRLRERYQIPEYVGYEDAMKLLSVWQEVQLNSYMAYVPITIATNVTNNTVAAIEMHSLELEGVSISESTTRIYPKADFAAHTLGYLGKISSENWPTLKEKGYSYDDSVGVSGIEAALEEYLTPNLTERQGKYVVEVDIKGNITRRLSSEPAEDGNNVILTIDADLQKITEEALERNIKDINAFETNLIQNNLEKYKALATDNDVSTIRKAEFGAAVVIDANTGEVLAKASYPSFDLNLFTGGISKEDFEPLNNDPRTPMFDKAIASKAMPGSIFKVATGLAGLMEGVVTVDEKIDDLGEFTKYTQKGDAPACWKWNNNRTLHQPENIMGAIKDSCNYYFYTVADRLGIDRLAEWGARLGLTSKTGIELKSEVAGQIGGQDVLYDNEKPINEQKTSLPVLVFRSLKSLLAGYCEQLEIEYTEEQMDKAASRLITLVSDEGLENKGTDIRVIMRQELGISETTSYYNRWHDEVSSLLVELFWNPNQTVRTGIGQGISSITPIGAARYIAAVVNGGTVYNLTLVKRIVDSHGNIVKEFEPSVFMDLDVPQEYINAIKEGMRSVVSIEDGGTAGGKFADFEYRNDIGGKTGSAQISGALKNIDIENTAWFVGFAPFDKPEIVVVIYIPHGYSGSSATQAARDIMQFYFDRKKGLEQEETNKEMIIPAENTLN